MKIKACSTNIRFENPNDLVNDWPNRRPLYSEFLEVQQFDLVGTQEGREKQIREFHALSNLNIIADHRSWIEIRMYPTLFFNPNKFKLINAGDFWLSETPELAGSSSFESAFPRLATWAILIDLESNKTIFVANMHLDHVKESTRIKQVEVAIEMINKINHAKFPIIVMGDFNDKPEGTVYQMITSKLALKDHWKIKNIPEESSHHGFTGKNDDGHRIDWFLVSSEFNCDKIYLDKTKKNDLYLSDHFPLVATFIPN